MAFGRPTQRDEQKAQAYAQWVQQRNPLAIASMVLGVFSLIEFGVLIIFGVGGIVLGIVALRQLAKVNSVTKDVLTAVEEPAPSSAGSMLYASSELQEPARASDYETPPQNLAPTRGHRLAWGGIMLSAISLVLAGILYLSRWGRP